MAESAFGAYRAFGVEPSVAYVEACALLRGGLLPCEPYVRPAKPAAGSMRDMAARAPFVRQGPDGLKAAGSCASTCARRAT